ncbi:phosphatase PAP2 family protein [Hymenobacter siberiensis]|uniref:phosphatase PAP2 family protein n=1 Tax=Hymenobacter siberiensis TaxID=2848396 RepID=UPI001C1E7C5E|nr:phosphatase PAP2 family protein [Hymenobacter siberiensis]MBU6120650.1 phosphatase PAP2 family protein [Hymenobacter siberiensis]
MISLYPRRTSRLFFALLVPLLAHSAGPAQARELAAPAADSAIATALPADTLAAEAQKPKPTRLTPLPMDSLPHIHPRDAKGRITDYTVAPGVTWHYDKPKPFEWAYHIPRDLGQFPGFAFRKENKETLIELAAGSVALWVADQYLVDWSQDVGKRIGLKAASTQKTLIYIPFSVGSANLPFEFNVPDNLNSTFYFLGDGWTHLTVASSFWIYGGIKKDNRALRTSSQLGEAIFSTGLVVQTMKRLTGRQSPYVATKERGEWHLFPSYNTYQNFVPNYDAFPTGHLATAMATVTVIAENYPEYHFIRPVGYGLMGLLGYSMLNNGVHWASDYPVGIALGYAFAKIAVRNGRTRVEQPEATDPTVHGTGFRLLSHPKPWYRRGLFSPYAYGPFTGASWSLRL